jgi:hypothetical protein
MFHVYNDFPITHMIPPLKRTVDDISWLLIINTEVDAQPLILFYTTIQFLLGKSVVSAASMGFLGGGASMVWVGGVGDDDGLGSSEREEQLVSLLAFQAYACCSGGQEAKCSSAQYIATYKDYEHREQQLEHISLQVPKLSVTSVTMSLN